MSLLIYIAYFLCRSGDTFMQCKYGGKAKDKKPNKRKAKSGRKRAFMRDERKSEEIYERNPLIGGENP